MKDCHRTRQLFSPYLDGELTPEERALVREHCAACASCRAELSEWQAIGGALQEAFPGPGAPAGFATGVMARIAARQPARRPWWVNGWAKGLATAAAAAMVLGGSWGLWGGQLASRVPVAVNKQPQAGQIVPQNAHTDTVTPVGPAEPGDDTVTNPTSPSDTATQTGEGTPAVKPRGFTTTSGGDSQPAENVAVAFTSKPRTITTTLLKVNVDDSSAAREQAIALAKDAGASCRSASGLLEITAPAAAAAALTDRLAALGGVEVRETDKKDITADFATALERYQTLAAQVSTAGDAEQKAQIQATMAALEGQLQDWDAQSSHHVITLWLAE